MIDKPRNTLVLLEDWKEHYLKKNIGINIQLHKNRIYIYCNRIISGDGDFCFIGNRISKYKQGIYYSLLRYIKTFYILVKYRIDEVNWGYISDDELLAICFFKSVFRRRLKIYVKTDSEDITTNRSFRLRKFFLEKIDKILVESDRMAKAYRDVLVKPEIITLFNPSVFEYNKLSRKTGIELSGKLLFVGRISPEKNIHELLDIFEEFADGKQDRLLNLVLLPEDEEYRNTIEKKINKLIAEGYTIRTVINPSVEVMHSIYLNSDILCITSTVEGVPNVLSDAFYTGLPVVSYKVGNIPFILGDDNLLCDEKADFVKKLERLTLKGNYTEVRDRFFTFYEKKMSLSAFKNNLSIENNL